VLIAATPQEIAPSGKDMLEHAGLPEPFGDALEQEVNLSLVGLIDRSADIGSSATMKSG